MRPSETKAAKATYRARRRLQLAELPTASEKRCPRCATTKPADEFHPSRETITRLATYCKVCDRAMGREQRWLRKYGITADEYRAMLAEQNGVCAICHQPCQTNEMLSVDHDHQTGRIRGLLCRKCNRAIGMLGDSPRLLVEALKYLLR